MQLINMAGRQASALNSRNQGIESTIEAEDFEISPTGADYKDVPIHSTNNNIKLKSRLNLMQKMKAMGANVPRAYASGTKDNSRYSRQSMVVPTAQKNKILTHSSVMNRSALGNYSK